MQKEQTASIDGSESYAVKFINPPAVVEMLDMEKGSVVADFGCGTGYFSLPIAEKIGEEGVVYSLDILPQSLESVGSQAKTLGLTNIITKRTNLEKTDGSKLPDASCDWVIMKDMLYQNNDKETILKEAERVMKKRGRALVIEWNVADSSIGPDKSLRISKESLIDLIQKCGLGVQREIPISNFHYGLILIK